MPPFSRTEIAGRTFGHWTVLCYDDTATRASQARYHKRRSTSVACAMWMCRCRCGTTRAVRVHTLLKGGSRSCGCLRAQERTEAARRRREERQRNNEEDFC